MTVTAYHGFAGAPDAWAGLADVAPWLPGHGPRGPVDGGWNPTVEELTNELAEGTLVGYSLGARLALAVALEAPEKVRRLVLVGGTAGLESDAERARRREWDEAQSRAIERDPQAWVEAWERLPVFAGQTEAQIAAQRATRTSHRPAALAWAMRALGQARMPPLWSRLADCPPTALVVGARDDKYVAVAAKMASRIPEAAVTIVPEAGHNVLLEAPAAVAEVLATASAP